MAVALLYDYRREPLPYLSLYRLRCTIKKKMKSLSVSHFREQITGLLERLPPEGVLVTKRGKPVARLIPVQKKTYADWIGCMKGRLKIRGDVLSTGRKWNAQS